MKVGLYVDSSNIYKNGGSTMRYDILRDFACRDGSDPIRLNVYLSYDAEQANDRTLKFHALLRSFGYKVILKEVKWYTDEQGRRFGKANADLDMAVDLLNQSKYLDKVVLVTGDGDFVRVIRSIQNLGCRVEVLGLDNVSASLVSEADVFTSGYLVPNLVPTGNPVAWGRADSTVRGRCFKYNHERNFGFFRFAVSLDGIGPHGAVETAYFNPGDFAEGIDVGLLPSYDTIYEFRLEKSDIPASAKFRAREIRRIKD